MAVKKSDIVAAVSEILSENADRDLTNDQIETLATMVGEKLVDEVEGVYDDADDYDGEDDPEAGE